MAGDKAAFTARMARLGAPAAAVEEMLQKAPVILRSNLTPGAARRYAEAVQGAGGRVTIQEDGRADEPGRPNASPSIASFREFTMCPECGLKQPKGPVCVKCGFRLGNGK